MHWTTFEESLTVSDSWNAMYVILLSALNAVEPMVTMNGVKSKDS